MSDIIEQVLRMNIYIQPLYFFLSITTNILNIWVLCSRALRASPCTHYFLGYAIFNLSYTCVICPTQFLRGFSINWANDKIGCKLYYYILFLIPFQANMMLILAAFDRFCSSSMVNRLHSSSTTQTTRFNILFVTILTAIYKFPILIIYSYNDHAHRCVSKKNILVNIYVSSQIYLFYILAPLLMCIFGLLTINNIHQQSKRAIPLTTSMRGRRTEGQLARMLILQIVVHIILIFPYGVTYIMNAFISSTNTPTVIAIRLAFATWQQFDYFIAFFLYILSGKIYRREFFRIFRSMMRCYQFICCEQIERVQ